LTEAKAKLISSIRKEKIRGGEVCGFSTSGNSPRDLKTPLVQGKKVPGEHLEISVFKKSETSRRNSGVVQRKRWTRAFTATVGWGGLLTGGD